jgi:hypothetical protein
LQNRRRSFGLAAAALALASVAPLHSLAAQPQPALADEMATAVPQLRAMLPKQVDEVTTWTGIAAEGTEFVYEMSVAISVPPEQRAAAERTIQDMNQARLCADPSSGRLIRRGGSMRHRYHDAAGNLFETRVVSCPPASPD